MKNKTYTLSPMQLIRGTSCAVKMMLDCPLDFLETELKERVKSELEAYARNKMAKTVADHCVKENQK